MVKKDNKKLNYRKKFLESSDLFEYIEDKKVILAYSGGPDSTFLLHMLLENGFNVELAYVNHMLRGNDSNKEMEFVKDIANKYGIKLHYIERDILLLSKKAKKGIEEYAREVRYEFFDSIPGTVATAHNLDDNVETFIFRLIRGTSLKGLSSISRVRGKYIRPIIHFSKKEILTYLQINNIEYVKDASNDSIEYTRNMIRIELIPLMEKINPLFKYKVDNLIKDISDINIKDEVTCDVEELKSLNSFDRRQYLSNIMKTDATRNKILLAENLLNREGSGAIDISKDKVLKKVYNKISIVSKIDNKIEESEEIKDIQIGDRIKFLESVIEIREISREEYLKKIKIKDKNIFFVDKNIADKGIKVRTRREGDYFYPEKSIGKKKLKKYFNIDILSVSSNLLGLGKTIT